MSESGTMFNEQDRKWVAVKLMISTDPNYDNRTIASTLKMQIRTVHNKVSYNGYGLWYGFKWGPHHATSYLQSRLESQHQSVPGCAEECGDTLVQPGARWQTLGVAAALGAGPQVQRDPGLASEGVLRLCTFLSQLISDVLLWTHSHVQAKAGLPAWTYMQQLCEDTGCSPEDLPKAMSDRERWRVRIRDGTTRWDEWSRGRRSSEPENACSGQYVSVIVGALIECALLHN